MCAYYVVVDSPVLWASVVVYLLINVNGKQLVCLWCPMEFVDFVVENSTKFN